MIVQYIVQYQVPGASIDLAWLPLGLGVHFVRLIGEFYLAIQGDATHVSAGGRLAEKEPGPESADLQGEGHRCNFRDQYNRKCRHAAPLSASCLVLRLGRADDAFSVFFLVNHMETRDPLPGRDEGHGDEPINFQANLLKRLLFPTGFQKPSQSPLLPQNPSRGGPG